MVGCNRRGALPLNKKRGQGDDKAPVQTGARLRCALLAPSSNRVVLYGCRASEGCSRIPGLCFRGVRVERVHLLRRNVPAQATSPGCATPSNHVPMASDRLPRRAINVCSLRAGFVENGVPINITGIALLATVCGQKPPISLQVGQGRGLVQGAREACGASVVRQASGLGDA